MPQKFEFSLIAPESKVAHQSAELAVMPGDEGDFGVAAGHIALIAVLKPGVVRIQSEYYADKPDNAWFITGGYADVDGVRCTVLADSIEPMSDLNSDDIQKKLSNLHEDLVLYEGKEDKDRIAREIKLMEARLRAVETFNK